MYYPFSLVFNDGQMFPELRSGLIAVFGEHPRAFAKCDYDGNMNIVMPHAKKDSLEQMVVLAKDFDTVFAWHGERQKVGTTYLGKVNWRKAFAKDNPTVIR